MELQACVQNVTRIMIVRLVLQFLCGDTFNICLYIHWK